jgi:hypothetical protein
VASSHFNNAQYRTFSSFSVPFLLFKSHFSVCCEAVWGWWCWGGGLCSRGAGGDGFKFKSPALSLLLFRTLVIALWIRTSFHSTYVALWSRCTFCLCYPWTSWITQKEIRTRLEGNMCTVWRMCWCSFGFCKGDGVSNLLGGHARQSRHHPSGWGRPSRSYKRTCR